MLDNPLVSVLITTYKRAHMLKNALEALTNQTYKNFEVVLVVKPSGDGTEAVAKDFTKLLRIKLVIQNKGYITDAINLGFENVRGEIIAFLDDDAIPFPDWIQNHVETYRLPNVGGVAGNVIPATLKGTKISIIKGKTSEIIPDFEPFGGTLGFKTWMPPVKGLEDHLVYVSKAGVIGKNPFMANIASIKTTRSLLGMGANMSVLAKAVDDFRFTDSWILGLGYEQFLGWFIWKKGYNIFFTPSAKVHHIAHGQTLSRNIAGNKKQMLVQVEGQLFFYRLYGLENNFSIMRRISWIIFSTFLKLKQSKNLNEAKINLKGTFVANLIGCKWLISNSLCLNYKVINDLKRYY